MLQPSHERPLRTVSERNTTPSSEASIEVGEMSADAVASKNVVKNGTVRWWKQAWAMGKLWLREVASDLKAASL